MAKQFLSYPSIDQFKNTAYQMKQYLEFRNIPELSVLFQGTVKLHGTNAACIMDTDGDIYFQSRSRILDTVNDNCGFCNFGHENIAVFKSIFDRIKELYAQPGKIQLYGEWCGGNIQKGVGLNKVPRMFVIFDIRISEDDESKNWFNAEMISEVMAGISTDTIKHIYLFDTFFLNISTNNLETGRETLEQLTREVEKDCPVSRAILGNTSDTLPGEGIVWKAKSSNDKLVDLSRFTFKTKGEEHKTLKTKQLVPMDVELANNVSELVNTILTNARLEQGIAYLKEQNLPIINTSTMHYINWVIDDCFKECNDIIVASGIDTKLVKKNLAETARKFFLNIR